MLFLLSVVPPTRATERTPDPVAADYLLHRPGIGGYRWIDRQMIAGLKEGGYDGRLAVHDWPGDNAGLEALLNRPRNEREAQRVAGALEKRYRENPRRRIVVTAHSGGTGIAVWALEKLPADVKVDTVVMLASALSPEYDLTESLRHVRGRMYSFTSLTDTLVLGVGTKTFGTIDGIQSDAAGRTGFVLPSSADAAQYAKLVSVPYDADWMRLDHIGDHIGPMSRAFAAEVLTPIVRGDDPSLITAPTTPATARATTRPATRETVEHQPTPRTVRRTPRAPSSSGRKSG